MLLILDASIIISFLISDGKSYARDIVKLAYEKKVALVTTKEIFEELRNALKANKIKKLTSYKSAKIGSFIVWYQHHAQFVSISHERPLSKVSRDLKDNMYLLLAQESKADFLITIDKDLLVIKDIGKTKIVTSEDFIKQ